MTTSINSLVLDAGPLLTQTYSDLHSRAEKFFTTPSVYNEIKDERARQNLSLWADQLVIRQPKPSSITAVSEFSKKTGDYAVLSSTDMHILALCYELEIELNGGDWRLRKVPGQKNINGAKEVVKDSVDDIKESGNVVESAVTSTIEQTTPKTTESNADSVEHEEPTETAEPEDDGWSVVAPKSRSSKKNKRKNDSWSKPAKVVAEEAVLESNAASQSESVSEPVSEPVSENQDEPTDSFDSSNNVEEIIEDDYDDEDDEDADDWITTDNLQETLEKGDGDKVEKVETKTMKAAMSTGDFAMQNVALQMGLNLVNPTNGKHIKRVKNYMLRCHACFKLTAFPKDGTPRQFCPRCGGATLLRCTVQVSDSGKIQVFLKKNMQWSNRGDKFSLPTPQSRRARKVRHEQDPILLREDQKEYQKAVKDSMWKKRQNEKLLDEWIGTGSADSVASPFAISGYKRDATKHTGVRVGRGRYVNDVRRKA